MDTPLFWSSEYARIQNNEHTIINFEGMSFPVSTVQNGRLASPGRATFGGFWSDTSRTHANFTVFLDHLQDLYPSANELKVTLPPAYFQNKIFDTQNDFFARISSYKIVNHNYHTNLYEEIIISKGNRKKLRQFREIGGQVQPADTIDWKSCYQLLVENRARRGVKLSMNWQIFYESLLQLPDDMKLWKAVIANEIVGCALTVKISNESLYVLFWGDNDFGRRISVVASIYSYLIEYSTNLGMRHLDLGISSVDGELDLGLSRFKLNLGSKRTDKITYLVPLTKNRIANVQK